jgi:hypothetical protein
MLRTDRVGHPVIETVITDRRRIQRIQFEHLVEVFLDQCIEFGSRLLCCLNDRLIGRPLIAGSQEQECQSQRRINAA